MRNLLAFAFLVMLAPRLEACSCVSSGSPCQAAGSATAAFTGKVLSITAEPVPPFPSNGTNSSTIRSAGMTAEQMRALPWPLRIIRIEVGEVLNGIEPGQKEIEIVTGMGGGDCGYAFQTGVDYVVYAHKNAAGRLETSICTRTRELAKANEDLQYFKLMANAPVTAQLKVLTSIPGLAGKPGAAIIAERDGARYRELTDAAGAATFTSLPPGEYAIHAESDGDLPDDPKIDLNAKGCKDVTLFRTLRIEGYVTTKDGAPAARVGVEVSSAANVAGEGRTTDLDGHYEINIVRPGRYYLGINLSRSATHDTPYPRWFFPGVTDQAAATVIEFSGEPETRTFNFALPERQKGRTIEGAVLLPDGQPQSQARVAAFDSSDNLVVMEIADVNGRFVLPLFADVAYRIHTVWPAGIAPAISAAPQDIQPGSDPLTLRFVLSQPGNTLIDGGRRGPGSQ